MIIKKYIVSNAQNKLYNKTIKMDESVTSLSDETYRNVLLNRLQMDPNELQNFDPIIPQLLKKVCFASKVFLYSMHIVKSLNLNLIYDLVHNVCQEHV